MDNKALKKLEADLWESADLLRAGSKLTSNQYCMPVLGLLFLRYAYSRFKLVEKKIQKDRPMRRGRVMPVEASDFKEKSAIFLPKEAQYEYLVNLMSTKSSRSRHRQPGVCLSDCRRSIKIKKSAMQTICGFPTFTAISMKRGAPALS